jgi:hypothetical protein
MYEHLKIGSQIYAVHHKYAEENIRGGKIRVCRVKTFENRGGEIVPVLTEKGNARQEIDANTHKIYINLSDAIDAIRTINE